ncbi:formylglycine-generating enzyme family protein [Desulfobacula toluolica]|uniref:Uncharacterized protein related to sulfatase modifying factor n=1 Tax=Desulfobacula toluolica (strain DSM 7467 / Tol2) TaxID=651182 RepID=K0NGW0_DESTT|nr:formylglycine-generating enzyme family protein [Desulfobacula toluolica]CCK78237.1 uncharacterized protein related to sulfatase modifying factor [Desulfobacula toluolica Tol2]
MKKLLSFIVMIGLVISISHAENHQDFFLMLENSRKGDVEAMCDLGLAYFYGKKTLKDPFKAKCWIKKAYDNGSVRAEKIWAKLELWRYSGNCDQTFDDETLPEFSKGETFNEPVTGMAFVFIPKGCFIMGCHKHSGNCNKDERPAHKVCVDGFWMGKYEVSQEQWYRVMGENPSRFSSDLRHPVETVSFDDVQKFIQRLNAKNREKFLLPTEAQWEYACRNGGQKVAFPWGNESWRPEENCATCDSGEFHGQTAPVGSFFFNDLGLYDMGGNVKEWCLDVYHKKAYAKHAGKNPFYDSKGSSRVVRGGSFKDNTSHLRCTNRDKSIPGMRSDHIGFRLVMARDN